jgi:phosphoserine aminotransferase
VLPEPVLQQAAAEMLNYHGTGMSVMELSHRTPVWEEVMRKAEANLRQLLSIPANYKVLFHEGGATHQFSGVPLNLLGDKKEADYLTTGTWSKKAAVEAGKYCKVNIITDPGKVCNRVPETSEWKPFSPDAAYVYYCDNETIEGVEFPEPPKLPYPNVPLVCDMSSNLLSRRFDVSKFGLVYACAQKNFGPAGLTVVIVREDLLAIKPHPACPTIFSNKTQADNGSMYNTPACWNIYIANLVFEWIIGRGGLAAMEEYNAKKAAMLYSYIDESGFYTNPVKLVNRSRMNVPFLAQKDTDEKDFLAEAKKRGLVTLAGHRSVGGFRASIYNAMPIEGIQALIAFMKEYAEKHKK